MRLLLLRKQLFHYIKQLIMSRALQRRNRYHDIIFAEAESLFYHGKTFLHLVFRHLVRLCRHYDAVKSEMPELLVHLHILHGRRMADIHKLHDFEQILSVFEICFHHLAPVLRDRL